MRYLKGTFRSVDGKNTYKVSGSKLRNVQGVHPGMLPLVAVVRACWVHHRSGEDPARNDRNHKIFSSEDVFRDPALVERYGDAARVGAILVTTRDAAKQAEKEARKSGAGESVVASVPEGPSFGTVQTGNTPVERAGQGADFRSRCADAFARGFRSRFEFDALPARWQKSRSCQR